MSESIITLPVAQARFDNNMACRAYDVHIMSAHAPDWTEMVAPLKSVVIHRVMAGTAHKPTPAFRLSEESAQAMLDAMWRAGLRPSSGNTGTGDDRTIKAMTEHINDLRHMAGILTVTADTPSQPSTY